MKLYRKLLSTTGLELLDKIKRYRVKDYFELYTQSQKWSRDELENFQIKRIKSLLKHSESTVIFYKKRFAEAGFDSAKFRYLDELNKIPPLTRFDLQNNLNELISSSYDLRRCKKGSSSGSTGHPVIYFHDPGALSAYKAAVLFQKSIGGYHFGERWLNIWGNPTAVNIEWKKLSSKVSRFLFNEIRFPAYQLNKKESMEELLRIVLDKKPSFIYGYTNAIYLFAEFLKTKSCKLNFVKAVFTTAENLNSYQRKVIEENISRVLDHYGCSEINGIAAQSDKSTDYLILDPHVLVEFGSLAGNSTNLHKLIITDFNNYVLPLIRYENEDLAIPSPNRDLTIPYNRFTSLDGRMSDIIKLPSGGILVVPSFFGSRMLKSIEGIKQYQIVKYAPDRIKINLSINHELSPDSRRIIGNTLKEYLPEELKYDLVFNESFVYTASNKFKLFIDVTEHNT